LILDADALGAGKMILGLERFIMKTPKLNKIHIWSSLVKSEDVDELMAKM
jgi:hypothetical protein